MTVRSTIVRTLLLTSCSLAVNVVAAAPSKNDYASGLTIDASYTQPMIETLLPDEVYRRVTRDDLGDLRVFNADGVPVPHAFCAGPDSAAPEITEQALQVFQLRDRRQQLSTGSRVAVETQSGTRIDVQDPAVANDEVVGGRIHIIDARAAEEPLQAIRFDWQSPDGASEARVRIEASDDLDRWQTVVPASTLLLAQQEGRELRRERIALPQREYLYLRAQRIDGGPPLAINAVIAERVAPADEIEPAWFNAQPLQSDDTDALVFDAQHVAPVSYAKLRLPQENSSVSVSLQSRPDNEGPWRSRWSGESYVIVADTARRESPPARFEPTTDRYWRVHILKDAQVYQGIGLELGYRPSRLRFLTQGPGPFTVAFGSRRAEIARPSACNGLLGDVSAADRERLVEAGYPSQSLPLGGDEALEPLPKKTPLRVVVLWGVLVVGVGLLVAMALSLLKRVRPPSA